MLKRKYITLLNPYLVMRYFIRESRIMSEIFYAFYDSKLSFASTDTVLFVDLGSNLGQGYSWFSKFFNQSNVKFELFEPNPNCTLRLEELADVKNGKVNLHNVGVGVETGTVKFYGLDKSEGGAVSQGGSIVKEHNSNWYEANSEYAIDVDVINFSNYLREKEKNFDIIIVKMDIESAELDLLEKLIIDKTINCINVLYVEFHSQYQEENTSRVTRAREKKIIQNLKDNSNVKLRLWR